MRRRLTFMAIAAAALLTACGNDAPQTEPPAAAGLSGQATVVSDVQTEPDRPWSHAREGRFVVDVPDGSHLLCFGHSEGDDIIVSGCAAVAAPAHGLVVSSGEAGFLVER